jgi:hypothetical protein
LDSAGLLVIEIARTKILLLLFVLASNDFKLVIRLLRRRRPTAGVIECLEAREMVRGDSRSVDALKENRKPAIPQRDLGYCSQSDCSSRHPHGHVEALTGTNWQKSATTPHWLIEASGTEERTRSPQAFACESCTIFIRGSIAAVN